jgi:hypothetical protein
MGQKPPGPIGQKLIDRERRVDGARLRHVHGDWGVCCPPHEPTQGTTSLGKTSVYLHGVRTLPKTLQWAADGGFNPVGQPTGSF